MSMRGDEDEAGYGEDDAVWIEAEIQRELEALNSPSIEDNLEEENSQSPAELGVEQEASSDEMATAELDEYIKRMQTQAARMEEELAECDDLLHHTEIVVSTPLPEQDDIVLLAKEKGMDAQTLKKKVLEELAREDAEDERLMLESVNEGDFLSPRQEEPPEHTAVPEDESKTIEQKGESPAAGESAFLTAVEEKVQTEEEEYLSLKRKILGEGEKRRRENEEQKLEGQEEEQANDVESGEELQEDEEVNPENFTLKPGEGTMMAIVDPEVLERRVMRDVLNWELKWSQKNDRRQQEIISLIAEEKQREEESFRVREQKKLQIEEQQATLRSQQQEKDQKLQQETEVRLQRLDNSIERFKVEMEALTETLKHESEALQQAQDEGKRQEEERRERAALTIQAAYRGYRVYKDEGLKVKAHLSEWKQKKTEARIKALDESRKKKLEERKRLEEEEQRKEEDKKRKQEEKKQKEEEEKKRKEEERKRKEEEKKRKEEEKRRMEEEKLRQQEEEKKRKIEEKKRKEEEKQRKLEEKRRQEHEEQARKENERKQEENRKLEEKIRKEEEERKRKEEELKRQEEARRLEEQKQLGDQTQKSKEEEQEDERKQLETAEKKVLPQEMMKKEEDKFQQIRTSTPMSPVPPEGRPTTPRKKMHELRRSAMSPLVNGVRSPPSSAESQRSASKPSTEAAMGTPQEPTTSPAPTAESVRQSRTVVLGASEVKTPRSARSDIGLSLPELIEKLRLDWMKQCRPWSKTERELKLKGKSSNRKPLKRPISAKNLRMVTEEEIVAAAGVASLQQVTTVELHDLPGCSIKPLSQCTRLRTLKVNNCGAVSSEGLAECKELVFLDLQNNALETLNLRDLQKLVYLDVSHNCFTSVHGLEGCTALRSLRATHNRITRISGLEGLKSLHSLDLSHNQLITSRGVGVAGALQEVNLSHNHLPSLDDLDNLGLLQVLKASGNNVIQPPVLTNQVLLRELVLDDNSLCSLRSLVQSWLPLLCRLSLAQNSLTSLEEMGSFISLSQLNISNNQILDIESLNPGLEKCIRLRHLKTMGNPVSEEPDFRSRLVKTLPFVEVLDGAPVEASHASNQPLTDFETMCLEQGALWEQLCEQYTKMLGMTASLDELASVHVKFFTTSHHMAVEQRYAHEYGHVNSDVTPNIEFDLAPSREDIGGQTDRSAHVDTTEMKNKFEMALQNVNGSNSASAHAKQLPHKPVSKPAARPVKNPGGPRHGNSVQDAAATRIQAAWRGYQVRRDIDLHSQWWLAATTIQAAWRGYFTRKVLEEMGLYTGGIRYRAATKIQALWRGYRVRKRIQNALNYAKMTFDDQDLDESLDFMEVDLSAFDFNEDDLEKDWMPPETPQLPANHAVIGKTASGHQAAAAKAAFDAAFSPQERPVPLFERPPHPPQAPRQAWRNVDSPLSDAHRRPLPPVSRMSDRSGGAESERTGGGMTQRTQTSRREERLTEEWGFKDSRTAELMMQRAKKLKYNAQRKKKISQLDPKQRLALFRKLEETSNMQPVQARPRKVLPKKEYFQAREEEAQQRVVEKQRENTDQHQRTYEWVHTQVGNYQVGSSRMNQGMSDGPSYNNEGNLPQIDPNVIAGARPSLTGSPMLMELQSLDSVSTAGDLQRRHSSGGDPAARLPPIKVSSAPSAHVKERMSFRNPKPRTLESVGWGGGKKRTNRR